MKNLIMLTLLFMSSFKIYGQQAAVMMIDNTGWHKIGETTVNFSKETDELIVLGADRFASVKLRVDKAPINLVSFVVYFEGGEKQVVPVGKQIKASGETQVYPLNGGERSIKKVVFTYNTVKNSEDEKAQVELWGMKTNTYNK